MNEIILEEYKKLQNVIEAETDNLNLIQQKVEIFQKNMSNLKEDILNIPVIDKPFSFLNKIFENFVGVIQKNINEFNNFILIPLDYLKKNFLNAKEQNLRLFKEIEENLYKIKKDLMYKRDKHLNSMKEIENEEKKAKNKNISSKNDENIFNNAIKDNYNQLYQYELNNVDEIIEENNIKYKNIYKEINTIKTNIRLSIKDCLIKCANNIYNYSESFKRLSKEIKEEIEKIEIKEEPLNIYPKFNISSKDMLNYEEDNSEIKDNEKKNTKLKIFNIFSKRKNSANLQYESNNITENDSQINIEELENKNIIYIENIIKNLFGEKELKSKEILDLFDILKINEKEAENENKYAKIFLNNLKKFYNNRIISFKIKKNFIHLSNVINSLCLKYKTNNNILILIIEVSQMIKYRNDYIYKIIQRKNEFLSTKTLWLQLVDNELVEELNKFVENKLAN